MRKILLLAVAFLWVTPGYGQVPPVGAITIGQTTVSKGTPNDCLYVTSANKVGNQTCGTPPIPALPGETGVTNTNYPPGHAFRYGMDCSGTTDFGTQVEYWMRSTTLPGVTAYLPACTFNFGMNTRPVFSYSSWYAEPQSLMNLMHLIASDGTSIPTATCTMSAGSLATVTVTFQGNEFFGPAPRVQIISGGGGNVLTGASVTALLELHGIDTVIAPGASFTVGDQVTFEHGIVLQVAAATGGVPTSWTIINRGTASADSRPRGVGQGNQYTQVSTTSSSGGHGVRMLFEFQITSSVTINSAGSGGAASCSVLFETPFFQDASFGGFWASLNRLGGQNARNITIQNYHGVDEPSINGGLHYGGEHLDSVINFTIDNYICDNAVQNGGFSGYACLAVESEAGAITDQVNIKHALIKRADWNAVVVCDARVNIGDLTVLSYGRANSITSTAYCSGAPNTAGYGVLVNRGMLHVGRLIVNNNEQLLGTLAQDSVRIVSVGYDTNPFLFSDDKSSIQQPNQWGVTFDDVLLTNVLRGGGFVIDNTSESGVETCDVGYGTMRIQFAASTAMTSGRAGVMVSSPGTTALLANKRCTLTGGLMEFFNTGTTSIAAQSPQPDGLIISASATVNASMVRFPNGGVGNLGLIQALGQFNGTIVWDQQTGIGLPGSTGANPVFLFQGTGTAGTNFRLFGNTYTQALSTTSPIVTFDGTSQVNASVWLNEPRNGSTIATLNTNTDLNLSAYLTGANGTGIGINYGGTLVRHRLSGFIGNFDTGLSPTSTPTCTTCSASNVAFGTNTTANNALAAGFFSTGFNVSGLSTTTQQQIDTGTKTATASAGAATLNKNAGVITSESLTTAAGSTYTLTLTNSQIAAADQVLASVALGTSTQGQPTILTTTPGAGSVVVVVKNVDLVNALNGTIKVAFGVMKN
jgi:hypothetical protein